MAQFLYPTSRQFPFDAVCRQIIRELQKRNWNVPDIKVEFHVYGTGEQKYRMVSNIRSADFKLWFCREQGRLPGGRWNDIAAVTEIVIPQRELHVYSDESSPTYYLYVGKDYAADRDTFMNGSKVNSKLNRRPRLYLEYKGGCDCQYSAGASFEAIGFLMANLSKDIEALAKMHHTHRGLRPPLLVHTNDLGREYDPEGDEPKFFHTDDVMADFRRYLQDVVLGMIVQHPLPTQQVDIFAPSQPTPFPESVGPLFCFAEESDAERIAQGKADPKKLAPDNRYALIGSGYRLASLGTPNNGAFPEIAYEGFLWCGLGEVTPNTPIESLNVPGHYRWSDRERYVIRLKPNHADDIYIADQAAYEERRQEIGAKTKGRNHFTSPEVADFVGARASTIVPITEYHGGYKQPIVLINRELGFDEVEIVSGPHPDRLG